MVQIRQERNLGKQCLFIESDSADEKNINFREQMLIHNSIAGIPKLNILQTNNEKRYEYNIEELETLGNFCERESIRLNTLVAILKGILQTVFRGHEFLLAENDYIITPETVFLDAELKAYLVYYAGYETDLRTQLRELATYIINRVDSNDEEAVLMAYAFNMRIKEESCSLEMLLKLLNAKQGRRASSFPKEKPDAFGERAVQDRNPAQDRSPAHAKGIVHDKRLGTSARKFDFTFLRKSLSAVAVVSLAIVVIFLMKSDFIQNPVTGKADLTKLFIVIAITAAACATGVKSFLKKRKEAGSNGQKNDRPDNAADYDGEETVLLYSGEYSTPGCMLVSDEYPAIEIPYTPFVIGKSDSQVDYVLRHAGISRIHAKIERGSAGYSVCDLNSTNGTYINGEKLAPQVPHTIRRGDEIRFGRSLYYMN